MSIKATEVGKLFFYGTGFDLSGAGATFSIDLIGPSGKVVVDNSRISISASDVTVKVPQADGSTVQQTFAGNTYMQFSTLATDFPVEGTFSQYSACGTYNDPTPKEFFGDVANFPVGAPC